jgi:hypothetical protein
MYRMVLKNGLGLFRNVSDILALGTFREAYEV